MVEYSLSRYTDEKKKDLEQRIKNIKDVKTKKECIKKFRKIYEKDVLSKFLVEVDKYCIDWCE